MTYLFLFFLLLLLCTNYFLLCSSCCRSLPFIPANSSHVCSSVRLLFPVLAWRTNRRQDLQLSNMLIQTTGWEKMEICGVLIKKKKKNLSIQLCVYGIRNKSMSYSGSQVLKTPTHTSQKSQHTHTHTHGVFLTVPGVSSHSSGRAASRMAFVPNGWNTFKFHMGQVPWK